MNKGSFISPEQRSGIRAKVEPLALAMGRAGLTPNMLTLIGFGIASLGGVMAALEWWLLAGIVATAGAGFDMFDGAVARATSQVSKLGAFMDSVFDRWGEALVYVGLVAGLAASGWDYGPFLAAAAMGSAFLVSYARAKSEGLGFSAGTGMAAVGVMPREIRLVILCGGLVLGGLLGTGPDSGGEGAGGAAIPVGILVIEGALAIIAIGATITVIQRVLHTRSQARAAATTTEAGERAS